MFLLAPAFLSRDTWPRCDFLSTAPRTAKPIWDTAMKSFAEFEPAFLGALQQERSELQGLQGQSEAQLSGWIEHLFRQYLGYTHWKEIVREGSSPIGSKGSKQLFPDLRIDVLDNGVIFVECKRLGRLEGPQASEELL